MDFDALFASTRGPLKAYLTRVSGEEGLAEDLMQEAYLRILTHPPRDSHPKALRAWVFTTATRLLQAHWRRQRPFSFLPWKDPGDEVSEADLPCPEPSSERQLLGREAVERGWTKLTRRQRSLLWLALVEEHDHPSIAQALGLRQGSVKVLLHRARKSMAEALVAMGLGPMERP